MSKKTNKRFGIKGELIAAQFLLAKGYKIIQKNFRTRYGEIDIIAQKDNVIYLIEVRARNGFLYGTPEQSLTARKRRKLRFMALFYLNRSTDLQIFEIEFICITQNEGLGTIRKYNITDLVMNG